jgi:hypothetical protein
MAKGSNSIVSFLLNNLLLLRRRLKFSEGVIWVLQTLSKDDKLVYDGQIE